MTTSTWITPYKPSTPTWVVLAEPRESIKRHRYFYLSVLYNFFITDLFTKEMCACVCVSACEHWQIFLCHSTMLPFPSSLTVTLLNEKRTMDKRNFKRFLNIVKKLLNFLFLFILLFEVIRHTPISRLGFLDGWYSVDQNGSCTTSQHVLGYYKIVIYTDS